MSATTTTMTFRYPLPPIPAQPNTAGLRGLTYSGFRFDEVSSAAQKSVRRGQKEEAIQWFLELFWSGTAATRTNIWNRALVMAVEDIGPSEPLMILKIWHLYCNHSEDPCALATAAWLLASASWKTRINDAAMRLNSELETPSEADKLGTPKALQQKLESALQRKDVRESLFYAKALFNTSQEVTDQRFKKAQWLVWTALENVVGVKEWTYIKALREIGASKNWSRTERNRLLHVHAILLWCRGCLPPSIQGLENVDVMKSELNAIVEKTKMRQDLLGIPDYAVDMHTARGKSLGRDWNHFMKQGALVDNEDPQWTQIGC
jgi:hypothetical protein